MKLYIINGPNLNMLGIREPQHYGTTSYDALCRKLQAHAEARGVELVLFQSNHEGALVDKIQEAFWQQAGGIVINPAAYTHTSIALLDALKATGIPAVEVHISKVEQREAFRQVSYVREACLHTITGHGIDGYMEAMDLLIDKQGGRS